MEQLAFRRSATGGPISEYGARIDRARVNRGGRGTGVSFNAANVATSRIGVSVAAHATPHTKGTPVELTASTPFDAETVEVVIRGCSSGGVNTSMLLDIVTGAALDQVLIPNLICGFLLDSSGIVYTYTFPVAIPGGTRVGAQIQGAVTVDTLDVAVRIHRMGTHSKPGTVVTALGVSTVTSNGITLTVPASANTKPTGFDTIIDPTTQPYRYIVAALSLPAATTSAAVGEGLADFATGAAGVETVIVPDIPFGTTASEDLRWPGSGFYRVDSPVGTRFSARYSNTSTGTDRRVSVAMYGVL